MDHIHSDLGTIGSPLYVDIINNERNSTLPDLIPGNLSGRLETYLKLKNQVNSIGSYASKAVSSLL